MPEGIEAVVEDGFARIQFADPAAAGPALARLLETAGPGLIDVDTRSGRRKVYIVPESVAVDAGMLDGVRESGRSVAAGPPSDSWTVAQLRDYAARDEIDLRDATRKADVLAAIREAMRPARE